MDEEEFKDWDPVVFLASLYRPTPRMVIPNPMPITVTGLRKMRTDTTAVNSALAFPNTRSVRALVCLVRLTRYAKVALPKRAVKKGVVVQKPS